MQQMGQGFLAGFAHLRGQLFGSLVELAGHLQRFLRRTTHGHKHGSQFGEVHNCLDCLEQILHWCRRNPVSRLRGFRLRVAWQCPRTPPWPRRPHGLLAGCPRYRASAETMVTFSTPTRVIGLLTSPPLLRVTGASPIAPSTSSPRMSRPKAVYCRSRNFASARQMKNWLPAESGSCERAIEMTPRTCDLSLNSAWIS